MAFSIADVKEPLSRFEKLAPGFKIFAQVASLVLALAFIFSCSSDDGSSGDSFSYQGKIVKIGNQIWMAENLNYNVAGSKCYGNSEANCDIYGRLYDWATAMALSSDCNSNRCSSKIYAKHRGICPSGWHIPSDAEWTTLTDYVGGESTAGTKLKATSGWNDYKGSSGNGTDEFGFSALPGGSGYSSGFSDFVGNDGIWWSASEYDAYYAYYRFMSGRSENVGGGPASKYALYSVRCVQD